MEKYTFTQYNTEAMKKLTLLPVEPNWSINQIWLGHIIHKIAKRWKNYIANKNFLKYILKCYCNKKVLET